VWKGTNGAKDLKSRNINDKLIENTVSQYGGNSII